MPSLDVFKQDAFSTVSLTAAVNRLPFMPRFLGGMNLFSSRPISTKTAMIEERHGKLAILSTAGRGTTGPAVADDGNVRSRRDRQARAFVCPHVPQFQTIYAEDIQDIRSFGSETELELVSSVVADEMTGMRQNHEATHEWQRLGAVKGIVYDSDGSSVVYNFYDEFGVTQRTESITYGPTADYKALANSCHRKISENVGGQGFTSLIALCGDIFFDNLVSSEDITTAYDRWRESFVLRVSQLGPDYPGQSMAGIDYSDILWVNYRGLTDATAPWVDTNQAIVFPSGVPDMFVAALAPGDMMAAANTRGQLLYASQERLAHDVGIQLKTQSNVLYINTYPGAVVTVTGS